MFLSLSIISSITVYTQFSLNKNKQKKSYSPFLYIGILFAVWTFFNFLFFNFGVTYTFLRFAFIVIYGFITCFYFIFIINQFKTFIFLKKEFIKNIPILFVLLFFSIFLLFYEKTYFPYEADHFFYYEMMNYLHNLNSNHFTDLNYAIYYPVGLNQLGSSLDFYNRLFIYPFFTTYFYFYVIFTSLYFIIDKYLDNWFYKSLFLITLFILFFLLWIYLNIDIYYAIIVGNISSPFLLSLILMPSFINIKYKNSRYELVLLSFAILFYNESIILLDFIYVFSLMIVIFIYRKKYSFSFEYFMLIIMFFVFCILLTIYYLFILKNIMDLNKFNLFCYLFPIFIILSTLISFSFLIYKYRYKKSYSCFITKINEIWFAKNKNIFHYNWFIQKIKIINVVKLIEIIGVFVLSFYSSFALYKEYLNNLPHYLPYYFFIGFLFSVVFSIIIVRNKKNIYFNFYIFLLSISAIISLFFIFNFKANTTPNVARFLYIGIWMTYGAQGLIHDIVLFLLFLFISLHHIKKSYIKFKCKNKINVNNMFVISCSTLLPIVTWPIIIIDYKTTNINKIGVNSIQNTIFYGLSLKTINDLEKFNFSSNWVFSTLALQVFNTTLKTNLQTGYYTTYMSTKFFLHKLWDWVPFRFKDINGNLIWNYDNESFKNQILPYYNYVVIRNNDYFFYPVLKNNTQFKLIDNINNQILIFKNMHINLNLQNKFMQLNKTKF